MMSDFGLCSTLIVGVVVGRSDFGLCHGLKKYVHTYRFSWEKCGFTFRIFVLLKSRESVAFMIS